MNCSDIQDLLTAHLDGELPHDMGLEIDAHVEACAECRAETEALRSLSATLRVPPPAEPSPSWDLALGQKLAALKWRDLTDEITDLRRMVEGMSQKLQEMEATKHEAENPLMTVQETAEYLHLTAEQIYSMLDTMPYVEMNYEIRFRKTSLDRWLEGHETHPDNEQFRWVDWIDGRLPHFNT